MRPRNPSTRPRVFARSRIRPWGLEPTARRRHQSIEPVIVAVRQRTCLRAVSRTAHPPFASPEPAVSSEGTKRSGRLACMPGTCCPRPLSAAPRASGPSPARTRKGARGWTSETLGLGLLVGPPLAGWAVSFGVLPLVEPAHVCEPDETRGLDALRDRPSRVWCPTSGSPRGRALRRRNATPPR